MGTKEAISFCRICEPTCGMIATVEDGKLVSLRPDSDHPVTAGFSCPKGLEFIHVQNDEDRITHPLRRRPDGSFEQITWETAISEIGTRLRAIRQEHGGSSIGWYAGNPTAFSHSHALWSAGFVKAVGSQHLYSANTQDTSSRFVASALLYGNPIIVPIPDIERTAFLLIIGSNPLVSRGSLISAGNMREKMSAIVKRGGRVVVIDPRRTETAKAFEHQPVRPDGDAWLLLAMLHVIFAEHLDDSASIARQSRGIEVFREAASAYAPEDVEIRTGIPADTIRQLARDLAAAPTAAIHGRTGACLGRNATLVNLLIDVLNLVTGNLDRPGGLVFGRSPVDFAGLTARAGVATYDTFRSRVGGLPEVLGQLPAPLMAEEIETPGPGQLRALIVSAGNPVLSVPGAERFEKALDTLDLQIGIDLYLNETHRHADYVLPAATFYERDDLVLVALDFHLKPFVQWTDKTVEPRGEAREDWRIIDSIAKELRIRPAAGLASSIFGSGRLGRVVAKTLVPVTGWITPERVVDGLLRTGRDGDLYGLRRNGISVKKLRENPRGIVLAETVETGAIGKRVRGGKLHLDDPRIAEALARLAAEPPPDGDYPLLMIGRRDVRSQNSWMHNTPKHEDSRRRQRALVHPKDAAEIGVADGDLVRVSSASGTIELPAEVTDDICQGTVAVPHGWGHRKGGWKIANRAGGANVNEITSSKPSDLEPLSGMSHLNGVPVKLEAVS